MSWKNRRKDHQEQVHRSALGYHVRNHIDLRARGALCDRQRELYCGWREAIVAAIGNSKLVRSGQQIEVLQPLQRSPFLGKRVSPEFTAVDADRHGAFGRADTRLALNVNLKKQ